MRENGVLLHISSLPSKRGIGALGDSAFSFVDFLAECGVNYWQMLPVGVTSYGDSPYQSPSAFAANPYFIDVDVLVAEGLLTQAEADTAEAVPTGIDYASLFTTRYALLSKAYARFKPDNAYNSFVSDNSEWLPDFALFMAIKAKFGYKAFNEWPKKYRIKSNLTENDVAEFADAVNTWYFLQYEFDRQMLALKKHAAEKGVKLIGDIPIYVAYDSAEVWANPKLFKLDKNLKPVSVAGVPPDYFAKYGQLWGNPLYNWTEHEKQGYRWWHARLLRQLRYFDKIRIDHFRAFESYYKIAGDAKDATVGRWVKGVRLKVFEGIPQEIEGRVIAEDLGIITDKVRRLVKKSGFPGMKVLQFAFDGKPENEHLPKKVKKNVVYYTGTHDNDTLKGWYSALPESVKNQVRATVRAENDGQVLLKCLQTAMKSRAELVVVPIQDYLFEGSAARMNTPGTLGGNWLYVLSDDYKKSKKLIKSIVKLR